MHKTIVAAVALLWLGPAVAAPAHNLADEVSELKALLAQAREDYESRIAQLETRLDQAERLARSASRAAGDAREIAEQTAIDSTSGGSAANVFNPGIGAVLIANYADIDGGWETIPGFVPGGELGPGGSGVSLGESEFNMKANIDSRFFGNLTLALEDEDGETEVAIEEAWIQTTGLSRGLTLTAGRFFSGTGYLNAFHRHADDFADRPLPYQAFLGGQYIPDGVQARWIAPTPLFFELGAELNWGANFPTTGNGESAPDAWALYARVGGDAGTGHSWQGGLSWLAADIVDRGGEPFDAFTGDSDLGIAEFVWKWAPDGNPTVTNLKLQAEYFWRDERGDANTWLPADGPFELQQYGWYLHGIWQFRPGWRVGYRHDRVSTDNGAVFAGTALQDPAYDPRRNALMLDWSASEYARLRLQFTRDDVLAQTDNQWRVQYLMSIGAHGAHQF